MDMINQKVSNKRMALDDMDEKITLNKSIFKEKEELMEKSSTFEKMAMPQSTASAV